MQRTRPLLRGPGARRHRGHVSQVPRALVGVRRRDPHRSSPRRAHRPGRLSAADRGPLRAALRRGRVGIAPATHPALLPRVRWPPADHRPAAVARPAARLHPDPTGRIAEGAALPGAFASARPTPSRAAGSPGSATPSPRRSGAPTTSSSAPLPVRPGATSTTLAPAWGTRPSSNTTGSSPRYGRSSPGCCSRRNRARAPTPRSPFRARPPRYAPSGSVSTPLSAWCSPTTIPSTISWSTSTSGGRSSRRQLGASRPRA